jgi:hypothetical protein
METDFNAQFDYIAELRAEHAEGLAALYAEAAAAEAYNAAIASGATEEEAMAAYYAA